MQEPLKSHWSHRSHHKNAPLPSISRFIFQSLLTHSLGSIAHLLHATASFLLRSRLSWDEMVGWLANLSTMAKSLVVGMLLHCLIPIVFHISVHGREAYRLLSVVRRSRGPAFQHVGTAQGHLFGAWIRPHSEWPAGARWYYLIHHYDLWRPISLPRRPMNNENCITTCFGLCEPLSHIYTQRSVSEVLILNKCRSPICCDIWLVQVRN